MKKLVRDKIPSIIKADGRTPTTYIADEEEYLLRLKEKLTEEVDEFLDSEHHEELADILEVVYALSETKNIDKEKLEQIRQKKADERGSFKEKIVLDMK